MRILLMVPLFLFSTGCETLQGWADKAAFERRQASKIMIRKGDPKEECVEVGAVEVESTSHVETLRNSVRMKAYHLRGNLVRQDSMDSQRDKDKNGDWVRTYLFTGTAFYCSHIKNVDFDYKPKNK